jgi:hypothetical protein
MTYVEAIREIQKRGFDALKVVQTAQIASLQATRDLTEALITPPLALLGVPPFMTAMANLTRSVAFQLLDQQIACAKTVTETLVGPMRSLSLAPAQPLAFTNAAPLEALPVVTEIPILTTLETVDDVERIDEAILVDPTQAVDLREATPNAGEAELAGDTPLASLGEAPAAAIETAEKPIATVDVQANVAQADVAQADVAEPTAVAIHTAAEPVEAVEVVALQTDVAEPPVALHTHVAEPATLHADPANVETAEVLAKMLPPPIDSAPAPRASAPNPSAKKPKTPAPTNNRAKSKRRPT